MALLRITKNTFLDFIPNNFVIFTNKDNVILENWKNNWFWTKGGFLGIIPEMHKTVKNTIRVILMLSKDQMNKTQKNCLLLWWQTNNHSVFKLKLNKLE